MRIRTRYRLFQSILAVGIVVFLLSLFDMFLNASAWQPYVLAAYVVLVVAALLLYIGHKPVLEQDIVGEELRAVPDGLPLPVPPAPEELESVTEIEEIPKPRPLVRDAGLGVSGPHSFKCPFCSNLFALEATHYERDRDFRMACPYCQNTIRIPKRPKVSPGDVARLRSPGPEERVLLACGSCGEVLRFTAPGSRLGRALRVITCPNCSSRQVGPAAPA